MAKRSSRKRRPKRPKARRREATNTSKGTAKGTPKAASPSAGPAAGPRAGWRRAWPHLVTAFALLHVVGNCASAIPNVARGLDRSAWQDPRARRELQAWADRLGVERPVLEDGVYEAGVTLQRTRTAVVAPFEPYLELAGLHQSWLMFAAGTEQSDRFGVRMRRCPLLSTRCDWETLYVHADPAHAWRANVLGHPRVRSAIFRWGWPSYRPRYTRGCRAIAGLVFEDFPDATAAQCRFERTTLPSPARPSPPPPRWGRERIVPREAVR
ncbi:MAG TPA: hypothetical protein RMH99_28020 [Sandaracinaceae bacterium LLY-WYZ-13_1]|nr:hypothetical protein [Sandaracinaceae bacterium LLY-WYZ-13_1]